MGSFTISAEEKRSETCGQPIMTWNQHTSPFEDRKGIVLGVALGAGLIGAGSWSAGE
jgi:hypothetical protein